jgi:hypothetical protein
VHDHLHEVVADLLELLELAQALLERVRGGLQLEQGPDACAEHEPIVRLREEVVATGLDGLDAIGGIVERGHEDHGDARRTRVALDAAAHLESGRTIIDAEVAGGHRHVEDAQVRLLLEARLQRGWAVVRCDRAKAEHVQLVKEQLHVRGDVVRHEDDRRVGWRGDYAGHAIRDER